MQEHALFIGLGVMGFHMAGHLSKTMPTYVYNRTRQKADAWCEGFTGHMLEDLRALPDEIRYVFTCIGNDNDLESIYLGDDGLIATCQAGTVLVDHTTASADIARRIAAACAEKGLAFIDAPVSGGEQGAINGQLTIMCGGESAQFERVRSMLDSYGKAVTLMGDTGAGQLSKMCNQIAVAGVIQGLAEAIHFSEQAGLDSAQLIKVISQGAAQSWQMENRSSTMIAGDYNHGFAVDWMRKDLNICLQEARRCNAKLPATALIDQFYADVQDMGGQRWDTSSLLERLRKK